MNKKDMEGKLVEIKDLISDIINKNGSSSLPFSISVAKDKVIDLQLSMESEASFYEKYKTLLEELSPKDIKPIIRNCYMDLLDSEFSIYNIYRPQYMEYHPRILTATYIVNDYLNNVREGNSFPIYSGIIDDMTKNYLESKLPITITSEDIEDVSKDIEYDIANRIYLLKDSSNAELLEDIKTISQEEVEVAKSLTKDFFVPNIFGKLLCSTKIDDVDDSLLKMSEDILFGGNNG